MKPKKAAIIAAVGIGVIVLLWSIWILSSWVADRDRQDFARICEMLNAEPYFGSDWLCIRDGEVVYE